MLLSRGRFRGERRHGKSRAGHPGAEATTPGGAAPDGATPGAAYDGAAPGAAYDGAGYDGTASSGAPPADGPADRRARPRALGRAAIDRLPLPRHRARFRAWRRTRPFWAGLFLVLGGLELMAIPLSPLTVLVSLGLGGIAAIGIGIALVVAGLFLWFAPRTRHYVSINALLLSVLSFAATNLGGFLIGMSLGIVGSAMGFGWSPGEQPTSATGPPRPAVPPTGPGSGGDGAGGGAPGDGPAGAPAPAAGGDAPQHASRPARGTRDANGPEAAHAPDGADVGRPADVRPAPPAGSTGARGQAPGAGSGNAAAPGADGALPRSAGAARPGPAAARPQRATTEAPAGTEAARAVVAGAPAGPGVPSSGPGPLRGSAGAPSGADGAAGPGGVAGAMVTPRAPVAAAPPGGARLTRGGRLARTAALLAPALALLVAMGVPARGAAAPGGAAPSPYGARDPQPPRELVSALAPGFRTTGATAEADRPLRPSPSPGGPEAPPVRPARGPGFPVAATPPTITTSRFSPHGFLVAGVTKLPTARGPLKVMVLKMEAASLTDYRMRTRDGSPELTLGADALELKGHVTLYLSRFKGCVEGLLCLTFTPDRLPVPPLVPPFIFLTDVEAEQALVTSDSIDTDGLTLSPRD